MNIIRQAITTKYCGPTNTRGARIKVSCTAATIYVPWDDALATDDNHTSAAYALCRQLNWESIGKLQTGVVKSGDYVHVFVK